MGFLKYDPRPRWWEFWESRAVPADPDTRPKCGNCGRHVDELVATQFGGEASYCQSCASLYDPCGVCGHARRNHMTRYQEYYNVWVECYDCSPQRLTMPGIPIAYNDWWVEKLTAAQHQFVPVAR